MKKYPYAVKYNGKYYPPNTPIEETAAKPAAVTEKPATPKGEQTPAPDAKASPRVSKRRKKGDSE